MAEVSFNRLAEERGLDVRALSAGTGPEGMSPDQPTAREETYSLLLGRPEKGSAPPKSSSSWEIYCPRLLYGRPLR